MLWSEKSLNLKGVNELSVTANHEAQRSSATTRELSVDILRGVVMVIMALDHVREFWGPTPARPEDIAQTSVLLFFTRWVTHLCAPTFIFLAGVSIYFHLQKKQSTKRTSLFTLTRGLWLILVELLIMSFLLTHGYDLFVLSILWAIGWSMIAMAGLIWLPRGVLVILSVLMVAGHNLLPPVNPDSTGEFIIAALHNTPFFVPQLNVLVAYTLVPWVAVMIAGFLAGELFTLDPQRRDRRFYTAAIALISVFLALRLVNNYGDPAPFSAQDRGSVFTLLSFLNVTKSPPSLQFLCLTLGIALAILPLLKRENVVTRFLLVFGRVPFFFFILHFALISLSSYLWTYISFGQGINLAFTPFSELPPEYTPRLARVYGVWIIILLFTWYPCAWFSEYKRRAKHWWVSYL
jgi:uncharacterized membrane protein